MGPPANGSAKGASATSSLARMFAKAKAINEEDARAEAEEDKAKRKVKKELKEPHRKKKVDSGATKTDSGGSGVKAKAKARVLKAKATAKTKGRPKAKAKIKVKREVEEKAAKRRCTKGDLPALDWQKQFYRHQSGFIDQVFATSWCICYGSLGTGLVGVRSQEAAQSSDGPPQEADDGSAAGDAAAGKVRGLQKDDVLILFRNAPKCQAQRRSGKMMAGYEGGQLDLESRSLHWSSQRSDRRNKIIDEIISHIGKGGRVIVAVRPPGSSVDDVDYRLLGQVSKVDQVQRALCLVNPGDQVIQEEGGRMHKAMTAACLSDKVMKEGGLRVTRCVDPETEILCTTCCYRTPNLVLHFDDLEPAGVEAYFASTSRTKVKEELEEPEDEPQRPRRRYRKKRPLEGDETEEAQEPGPEPGQEPEDPELVKPEPVPDLDLSPWPESICIKRELPDF